MSDVRPTDPALTPAPEVGVPTVADHPYESWVREPWGRCIHCGLAEAAHATAKTPYRSEAPRAG